MPLVQCTRYCQTKPRICTILGYMSSTTLCMSSYTNKEQLVREHTSVSSVHGIKLHLVTKNSPIYYCSDESQLPFPDPWWAFAWPGGTALSRYILDSPDHFKGKSVCDIGSGCGLSSLAAAAVGSRKVVANDIDPFASAALSLNIGLNDDRVPRDIITSIDTNMITADEEFARNYFSLFDIILCGDMLYDPLFATQLIKRVAGHPDVLFGDPGRVCCPRDVADRALVTYPFQEDGFNSVSVFRLSDDIVTEIHSRKL